MIQTPSTQNIISFVQGQKNDLTKIKRRLLYCFKYLVSILPSKFSSSNPKPLTLLGEGSLQENSVFKNSKNPEIPAQFYWTPYQRRWYVARKAEIKEIPSKLENKPRVGQTVVRFLGDKTYSLVSTSKLVPIGQDEVDKKRAKGDAKGYAEMENILKIRSTKPQDISEIGEDEIVIRDENESSKNYSAITPLVGKLSLGTDYDVDELDAVLNAMILNDQKLTFTEEYKALQLGENIQKNSNIATLSPFLDKDGLIKMKSRL